MKVLSKQHNSRMCIICGLDNEFGIRAPFYNMQDGSVMTKFRYDYRHQSYPERVHGGLITAMLDEMGLRSLWADEMSEQTFGVTFSLETKFRKPVPYGVDLIGKGKIIKKTSRVFVTEAQILDLYGNELASARLDYLKLDVNKIAAGTTVHDEMCYLIEDGVTEL